MPRKAMKCIVQLDIHSISCPGTFLKSHEYVYLHVEMLGLEARSKSVPPNFPLFFHERLKFERLFKDCLDPSFIASTLKGEDIIFELRQHTDYISDGKVISHCSSNVHDFLYPPIPPYYGSGREILLYKTTKFKPIRVTGEPVKLEFTTKTTIKEITDPLVPSSVLRSSPSIRSSSPSRNLGTTMVEDLSPTKSRSFLSSTRIGRPHNRSRTSPIRQASPIRRLERTLDDLDLSTSKSLHHGSRLSPNLKAALNASERIQRRVEEIVSRKEVQGSSSDSEDSIDLLRESLREERLAINNAIREADREALNRSLGRNS